MMEGLGSPASSCADDVMMTFSRSQGAGGQNVNKVSTKADIRFDVKNCDWLSSRVKEAVIRREPTRMNKQVRRAICLHAYPTAFSLIDSVHVTRNFECCFITCTTCDDRGNNLRKLDAG